MIVYSRSKCNLLKGYGPSCDGFSLGNQQYELSPENFIINQKGKKIIMTDKTMWQQSLNEDELHHGLRSLMGLLCLCINLAL